MVVNNYYLRYDPYHSPKHVMPPALFRLTKGKA